MACVCLFPFCFSNVFLQLGLSWISLNSAYSESTEILTWIKLIEVYHVGYFPSISFAAVVGFCRPHFVPLTLFSFYSSSFCSFCSSCFSSSFEPLQNFLFVFYSSLTPVVFQILVLSQVSCSLTSSASCTFACSFCSN